MRTFKTEAQVLAWLTKLLKFFNKTYYQKFYLRFTAGFPDLLVIFHGSSVFYELKVFKGDIQKSVENIEPIQRATLKRIHAAGGKAYGLIVKDTQTAWLWNPADEQVYLLENFETCFTLNPTEPWDPREGFPPGLPNSEA